MDLWKEGFTGRRTVPVEFLWALQIDLGWYVAFWLLAVAGASASSIAIEREKDTWVSLTATPLTAREILRGKVLGAMWNQRGFAAVLIFVYAVSLITGAAHPLGVLASIALLALLTWFVAIVGVYCLAPGLEHLAGDGHRRWRPSPCFNGYPVIVLLWFIGAMGWESSYSVLGAMPSLVAWSMASPETIGRIWATVKAPSMPAPLVILLSCVGFSLLLHLLGDGALPEAAHRPRTRPLVRSAPAPPVPEKEATSKSELAEATAR